MKTFVIVWLAVISAVSLIITVYDKYIAANRKGKRRVPENTLLLFSVLGGSVVMLLTMYLIRHKTRHPKFMVGIPLIIAAQLAVVYILYRYGVRI